MGKDSVKDNQEALLAAGDASKREAFLAVQEQHILRLAGKISGHMLTKSDDEWSIALSAVDEALDRYKEGAGDFWSFASVVIKSRLNDYYRRDTRYAQELSVRPEAFDNQVEPEEADYALQQEIESAALAADGSGEQEILREEIEALGDELKELGISFFDLAEASPKSSGTRKSCALAVAGLFLPPPLIEQLRRTGTLPGKELKRRVGVSGKLLDRHRKYLIAAAYILSGEYPALSDYLRPVRDVMEEMGI